MSRNSTLRGRLRRWATGRRSTIRRIARPVGRIAAHTATVVLLLSVPAAAYADTRPQAPVHPPGGKELTAVITDLQIWVIGIVGSIATLYLVLAGVYWTTAGGDPAQVDKAKGAFKSAVIGYAVAVLAPTFLQIVKDVVGG